MTATQIAINLNDKIELYSGSNEWSIDGVIVNIEPGFVYIQTGNARCLVTREAVETDEFGFLFVPRHLVTPLASEGQIVHSARGSDTHGCRVGWTAKVYTTDSKTVLAMIVANQHCYSCHQAGCVDDGQKDNDRVGEAISFNFEDCEIDQYGQIVVNKLIS